MAELRNSWNHGWDDGYHGMPMVHPESADYRNGHQVGMTEANSGFIPNAFLKALFYEADKVSKEADSDGEPLFPELESVVNRIRFAMKNVKED